MVRRKQNPAANQAFVPVPRVKFEVWRRRLESDLKVETNAWKGLKKWISIEEESAKKYQQSWAVDGRGVRGHVLESLYKNTGPFPDDKKARNNRACTMNLLKNLIPLLDDLTEHLQRTGVVVESDGGVELDFSKDLQIYYKAANSARYSLALLKARGPESLRRDAVDQCLWFLTTIARTIPESQAYALAQLALKAHGYRLIDLADLNNAKIRAGKVRRRKAALNKLYREFDIHIKSYALRL
jgi:hypothetical protein